MVLQADTLNLQQDKYLSHVRDNPQYSIQRGATKMQRINQQIHDQSPMAHQGKTGKRYQNGNKTRTVHICGPTVVTASRFPSPTQGHTDQETIQICNSIC